MALESIRALWLKEGKKGKFMSGEIEVSGEKLRVMVFKNDKGDNDKRPDYRIMMAVDDEQEAYAPDPPPDDDDSIPF